MGSTDDIWTITQELTGSNDFTGSVPSRGGSSVEKGINDTPPDRDQILHYVDLDDGGEFDFPRDLYIREVYRIFLSLGDANSWTLDLVTFDGDGDEWVITSYNEADFGGNAVVEISGRALIVMERADILRLSTSGNTQSEIFASITVSPW